MTKKDDKEVVAQGDDLQKDEQPVMALAAKNPDSKDILSEADKAALTQKAKEMAVKEAKQKAEDDYLKSELKKAKEEEFAKRGLHTGEEMVEHTVNLPPASDRHMINGRVYLHGHTYSVPKSVADHMRDIEYRGMIQENIRKGNNQNEYGLENRFTIRGGSGVVSA